MDSHVEREAERYRQIFRRVHAEHPRCLDDEWLSEPCADAAGNRVDRPIVWSRRNGAWRRVEIAWVGAAPGNAGGKGSGDLGAHGTRIPFGGDVSGANVDVLFGSIGIDRNRTFIAQAYNQLPGAGGGEPTLAELNAPVGDYPSSIDLLRDTLVATGARLIVVFGNVALRTTAGALTLEDETGSGVRRLPSLNRLRGLGAERGRAWEWADALEPSASFRNAWADAWRDDPLPALLWIAHPSAQNMSPYAGTETSFHRRMLETRDALRAAYAEVLGRTPPGERAFNPETGIYALPEWRERIGPRHERLDRLWREKGV